MCSAEGLVIRMHNVKNTQNHRFFTQMTARWSGGWGCEARGRTHGSVHEVFLAGTGRAGHNHGLWHLLAVVCVSVNKATFAPENVGKWLSNVDRGQATQATHLEKLNR